MFKYLKKERKHRFWYLLNMRMPNTMRKRVSRSFCRMSSSRDIGVGFSPDISKLTLCPASIFVAASETSRSLKL